MGWLNRTLVLNNQVIFGTVNANRRHYEGAAAALAQADRKWLERLITRRVPLDHWDEALDVRPDDVKVIIEFGEAPFVIGVASPGHPEERGSWTTP